MQFGQSAIFKQYAGYFHLAPLPHCTTGLGKARLSLAVFFAFGGDRHYHLPERPDKHWASGVKAIEEWTAATGRHEVPRHVNVPINPDGWGIDPPGK